MNNYTNVVNSSFDLEYEEGKPQAWVTLINLKRFKSSMSKEKLIDFIAGTALPITIGRGLHDTITESKCGEIVTSFYDETTDSIIGVIKPIGNKKSILNKLLTESKATEHFSIKTCGRLHRTKNMIIEPLYFSIDLGY